VKIKKVDDKPMVIRTKEKAKIHSHEPKRASIKGSNIYTVDRTPKIKKVVVSEKPAKVRNTSDYIKGKNKQAYRKSIKHTVFLAEQICTIDSNQVISLAGNIVCEEAIDEVNRMIRKQLELGV
jgi:hypothetical protein